MGAFEFEMSPRVGLDRLQLRRLQCASMEMGAEGREWLGLVVLTEINVGYIRSLSVAEVRDWHV